MAGSQVKIAVEYDDARIRAALEGLTKRLGNLQPVFQDVGEYLLLAHDQRFRDQTSPEGDPWVALSEDYRSRKKRNQDRILVLDDILGATLRYQAGDKGLEFGTDRIYAATHQFGRDEADIPARPFLGLAPADEEETLRLIEEHLAEVFSE